MNSLIYRFAADTYLISALLLAFASVSRAEVAKTADRIAQPNFMIVLADDLGFSDLGCYGGEISTPNIDGLSANGLRYSQFYNTARCWPTRAALMTGFYAQQVARDALPGHRRGSRPEWAKLVSQRLGDFGYISYHAGKWHLDGEPVECGFQRSYRLRDHNRFFTAQTHDLNGQPLPPAKPEDNYYATTAIADYTIQFLQEHHQHHPQQPFFHFVAFTTPHFPLQAPNEDIEKYETKYRPGWDAIRSARWNRLRQLTELPGELAPLEPEIGPPYDFPDALQILGKGEVNRELSWDELSDIQQQFQANKMAVHAAMVDRMDREIGRIVKTLRTLGYLEDTLLIVLSDNGASAEIMVRGDGHDPKAAPGSRETFLCLGPGWSSAANTPFRRHKTWVHEGGIATPLIVHWPQGIKSHGQWRHECVGHVIDIAPTLLELAGENRSAITGEGPEPPGRSLEPTFREDVGLSRDVLWWLHQENRALRAGDWKIVAAKEEDWQLYNLAQDRAENNDLANELPDKTNELVDRWEAMTAEMIELAANRGGG